MPDFICSQCQKHFEIPQATLDKFPGWTPKLCLSCKNKKKAAGGGGSGWRGGARAASGAKPKAARYGSQTAELDLPVADVLKLFNDGPKSGVFTDGAANPNPGPGGWGAVWVVEDELKGEKLGHEPHTTNNRMELSALLAGIQMVPAATPATIFTDSELCVNTFTKWAKSWEKRGWKRKDGEIKNVELVREIYYMLEKRPELRLEWIAAHNGYRWNEYADALATAYRRPVK
jgi:ribonuclease HI